MNLLKNYQAHTPVWKQILKTNFTDWQALADYLDLNQIQKDQIIVNKRFPLFLPFRLARKIAKGTLNDPILKQFLPVKEEFSAKDSFIPDPVGDQNCRYESKLLKKYNGRALIVTTSACAMHCRFCFRQYFNYETQEKNFDKEIQLIADDLSLHEVILSGGDPLSLSNNELQKLLTGISSISHIQRIRFHTRFPIGIPERIDQEFLEILDRTSKQIWFVAHINHPCELDADIFTALKSVQKLGIPILNQAVLLREVNDNVDTLAELCEMLTDHGIMPYYLHQLDKVQGSAHFEVEEGMGTQLIQQLSERLSGFAIPRYVKEIYGQPSKTHITYQ